MKVFYFSYKYHLSYTNCNIPYMDINKMYGTQMYITPKKKRAITLDKFK